MDTESGLLAGLIAANASSAQSRSRIAAMNAEDARRSAQRSANDLQRQNALLLQQLAQLQDQNAQLLESLNLQKEYYETMRCDASSGAMTINAMFAVLDAQPNGAALLDDITHRAIARMREVDLEKSLRIEHTFRQSSSKASRFPP